MVTFLQELEQLVSALAENEIEYAVCGGLIKMKTLAGRAKDLIDIDRIENEES